MKKLYTFITVGVFILFGVLSSYMYYPEHYSIVDKRLKDFMFMIRGERPTTNKVAIVDIDEKSLKEVGQWPWPRVEIAKLLYNIAKDEPKAIGLDIVFAESDNSSPRKVLSKLGYEELENIPDYDEVLAEVFAGTPTVSGYIFVANDDGIPKGESPKISSIVIERGKGEVETLMLPYRAIANIPILQENSVTSGFFNTVPDDDGIIRSVPLMMKYENALFPALSLEMVRFGEDENKIYINYNGNDGISSIELGKHNIPTDRFGRMIVNFYGGAHTFEYISATDILNERIPPEKIKDRYILIGTSASGLLDLRSTPYESVYPGVEVHATAIENIITDNYIYRPNFIEGMEILSAAIIFILTFALFYFTSALWAIIVATALFFAVSFGVYFLMFEHGLIISLFLPSLILSLSFISATVINYFFETRQKELIKARFAKKVSPAVVEELMKSEGGDVLEGKEKYITIFFSDVRGFTTISEALGSPKALIDLLNEYMTPMVEIIVQEKGTIDKFIGDAIMAYWNAPNDVPDHEDRALTSAIKQINALKGLNVKIESEGKPRIDIGIGLNSGLCTVGEMGSAGRADYTIIGDPVNLGSRLEGLCKPYGAKIILSEFTLAGLKRDDYLIRELDMVKVKGKTEPVRIYESLGFKADEPKPLEEIERYSLALKLYYDARFKEALGIFEELYTSAGDKLYAMYKERCEHFIENPPENFDGVFTFTTK